MKDNDGSNDGKSRAVLQILHYVFDQKGFVDGRVE